MHWSLDTLRAMDADEYEELLTWAQDKGKPADSMDVDDVLKARTAKEEGTSGGD